MDLYSKRIIGWQLAEHIREELVIAAFKKALQKQNVEKRVIVHWDKCSQYAGKAFRKLIDADKQLQSMSRADNSYDKAFIESCFSSFSRTVTRRCFSEQRRCENGDL